MDEDILAQLESTLTNVNLDNYQVRKVGDFELWLAPIDYTQSNKIKKVLEGEFGLEEAKRVTLSSAIIGVNGMDLRPLRDAGKTIKVKGRDGKSNELVDLPEFVYRKIARWDVEFVDVVFDVYSDIIESHKRRLVKDITFENMRSPEEELSELEEKAASLRERLGKPPLVEARRLDLDGDAGEQLDSGPEEEPVEDPEARTVSPQEDEPPDLSVRKTPPKAPPTVSLGDDDDFDPFEVLKASRQPESPPPIAAAPPISSPIPPSVPVPTPAPARMPATPSEIELAMARRNASSPLSQSVPDVIRPHLAQPSVPVEVIESAAAPVVVDPPRVNPGSGSQSRNPRFRNAGGQR